MGELEIRPFRLVDERDPTRVVRGRIVRPSGGALAPVALVVHGFKGFMDWGFFPLVAESFARRGIAAVAFNVSGSGVGEDGAFSDVAAFEHNTYSRELEDLERVRAHVDSLGRAEGLDPSRVAIFGHSRGGAMALLHAARRGDYRAVVTWAALSNLDRWDDATKELWRRVGWIPIVNARTGQEFRLRTDLLEDFEAHADELDLAAACRRLATEVLLIHAQDDEAVDIAAQAELAGLLPNARSLSIPNTGHTFGATHPLSSVAPSLRLALDPTLDFLSERLGNSTPNSD